MKGDKQRSAFLLNNEVKISPYVLPGLLIPGRGVSFNLIEHVVLNAFDSNNEETMLAIKSSSRKRQYAELRQAIFYFSYLYLKSYPLSEIGKKYNRDHSTVLHSVKVIKVLCETNKKFSATIKSINSVLKSHLKRVVDDSMIESDIILIQNRSKAKIEDYGINDEETFG